MHIFWGLLGLAAAYLLVRYRGKVYDFTGPWGFAEKYFGGTGAGIVLVAVLIFLISVTVLFGKSEYFFGGTLGKIF